MVHVQRQKLQRACEKRNGTFATAFDRGEVVGAEAGVRTPLVAFGIPGEGEESSGAPAECELYTEGA
jgi:hypothetical protein